MFLKKWLQNKKIIEPFLVIFLLLTMFLITFFASRGIGKISGDSGIIDEIAHIPAGYSYVEYQDFRLNPEHPPLAKTLAGIPLALSSDIKGIAKDWSWDGINQWEAGWYMLYESGNDPEQVLLWSRIPMMLLMIVLGVVLFLWARKIYGSKVGLVVLTLFAFYPDIIAHGKFVTTDVAAALGYVITIYFFDRAIREKTLKNYLIAGLFFAIAQLLKFSAFVLFGALLVLAIIRAYLDRKDQNVWQGLWLNFKTYFWVCFYSLVIVWLVYIPFVWNTPPAIEHQVIETNLLANEPRTLPLRNFLHLMENNPVTRALAHYLLGIFMVIGRVEGGNTTFALGQLSYKSISWFFPFAWIVKTPVTVILLAFVSWWIIIKRFFKKSFTKDQIWLLSLILVPIILYWGITLKGSLNIGIRHLMPTVPFVLLLIGFGLNELFKSKRLFWTKRVGVGALLVYMIISVISYFPSYVGYFNELVPRKERYKYLVDSSLDWGQDLMRLRDYVRDNHISEIKVDYFGGSVPEYFMPEAIAWHSDYGPTSGWLAVSATFYQSSKLVGPDEGKWSYDWLDKYEPKAIIGGSILVFYISPEELQKNPPKSPYPITKTFNFGINERKVGI